jgi:ketosteroid isomerase-like protein
MGQATQVIQTVYQAFGRRDIPGILAHCAASVDWEFVGPAKLGYAGRRTDHAGIEDFFAKVAEYDDIEAFEPREFIEQGDKVVVLGWEKSRARDTGKPFESEWAHVFTVKDGKISRWRGFFDTASRYA